MFKGYYLRWRRNHRVNSFNNQITRARSTGDFVALKKLTKKQSEVLTWENLNVEFFESQRAVDAGETWGQTGRTPVLSAQSPSV